MKPLLRQVLERSGPRIGLTPGTVDMLVGGAATELVRAERSLCPQSRVEEVAVLVLDGAGRVECATPDGGVVIVQLVPPGQFVRLPTGRRPGRPAPALRAVAHVESWVAVIGAGLLTTVLDRLPGDRVLQMMASSWRALSGHLYDRCQLPMLRLPDRLLFQLGVLARDFGHPIGWGTRIELRLTHTQLAALVGGSRAAVCRAVGVLAHRGRLVVDGTRFVLPDACPRVAASGRC